MDFQRDTSLTGGFLKKKVRRTSADFARLPQEGGEERAKKKKEGYHGIVRCYLQTV